MNKLLASSQIVLGSLAVYSSWYLAEVKAHMPATDGFVVTSPPPDSTLEGFLTLFGLAVFGLAMAQAARHMRFANLQMICGVAILIISSFLYGRASAFSYGETSNVYRLAYLILAVGLSVAAIGVIQLFKEITHSSMARVV